MEPPWRMVSAKSRPKDDSTSELLANSQVDPNLALLSASDIKRCLKEYGVTEFANGAINSTSRLLLQVEVFLPLVGTWAHRKGSYKIHLNESGKLLWQGSHITGEPLLGVLQAEGAWICSELFTAQEEKIGLVRLRHGPEWNQLSLNFKTSVVTQWGGDVRATRVTEELRICRPPFERAPEALPRKEQSPAELLCMSLEQLKECLKEYGVNDFGRCCNHKESLIELLLKIESAVPLVGRWQYGKPPNRKSYEIRRLISGLLKWEGPHSRGGLLSGILEDDDGWFVAQLTTSQNETMGSIRLRHGPKVNEIMSNFRSHTMAEWGTTIIAERVGEEEPLRRPSFTPEETDSEEDVVLTDIAELSVQELKLCLKEYGVIKFNDLERRDQLVELLEKVERSLPLVGTWRGRHLKQYDVQHTEDGQLLWEGPHIFGGTLMGVLYEDESEWLRAELFTCKEESEQVGSVKISHGPDWHEMTLKFMQSDAGQWGEDIVAKRMSKEHMPRRPKPLPAVRDLEDDDEMAESQYWESLEVLSQALRVEHAALAPLERRAKSWARSVAFAQMTLGMQGIPMKGGAGETFVIWVLGATAQVEVSLAERGYFKDVNWLDRAPTKVYIIGENLLEELVEEEKAKTPKGTVAASVTKEDAATYVVIYSRVFVRDHPSIDGKYVGDLFEGTEVHGREEGGWLRLDQASAELCVRIRQRSLGPTWVLIDGRQLGLGRLLEKKIRDADSPQTEGGVRSAPEIRTACYEDLPSLFQTDPPDLGVILMPNFATTDSEDPPQGVIPEGVLELLGPLPVMVSSRCRLPSLSSVGGVLLQQMRCPFSAGAGDPSLRYDDNGWIFCATAKGLAAAALVCPEPSLPAGKVKIMFWGIVDLKYDQNKPILERIQVLETGDGRISKFSGDGAPIQKHFEMHYELQEQEDALQTYNFISKDKKLTHDLFDATGYGHIIPRQVCFPRVYYAGIASHISAELGLKHADDLVVLKLCNRSRGAGVLIVPVKDLEEELEELLEPPKNLEAWFAPQLEAASPASPASPASRVPRDSHEEHVRHWWANESPSFVAEHCCSSMPISRGDARYDGTMRVTFALRRRLGASDALTPEDIEVDWLGGYWKLPNADMSSSLLRERIISQAKTGTAPVPSYILMEVYGALSAALQQLFGAAEFTSERLQRQYQSQPELAAYLIARRAMSLREPAERLRGLRDVEQSIARFTVSPARSSVESFVHRAHGVLIARGTASERWKDAREHFGRAVAAQASNSNALFQLGLCCLELQLLDASAELMTKSLLLDSDFRAPYVNLGVVYLRQASHADPQKAQELYLRAIAISEACLLRHPASPQCNYHIGVASTQLAFHLQSQGVDCVDPRFVELRARAQRELRDARKSVEAARRLTEWQEAQARGIAKKQQAPWLPVDDKMLQAVELHMMQGQTLKAIKIPDFIGWRLFFWRV